ncbi:MAG: hypothetical protein IK954_03745 [Clostridia bacterium]|nr:hypothetical protein [Clostridia bacterium]
MKTKILGRVLSVMLALSLLLALLPTLTFSAAAATEVTLTFSSAAAQDASSRYLIFLDVAGTTVTDRFWNNNTVYIDGKPVSGTGVNYAMANESQIFLCLQYKVLDEGATVCGQVGTHTLLIKAGTSLGNNGDCVITNDLAFKISGSSVTQLKPVALAPYAMIDQVASSRYWISLYDKNGTAFDTTDRYWNNNTAILDGQPITAGVNYYNGETGADPSRLVLLLSYGVVQAGATSSSQVTAHTLTIPSGAVLGNLYLVTNELTFSINGNQITRTLPQTNVTLSNDEGRNASGSANGFYFYVDPADPLAFDVTNWSTRYPVKSGSIKLNDTVLTNARTLTKVTDNLYFVSLLDNGVTAVVGDVVTVDCSIDDGENQVNLQKQQFILSNNGWELYVPATATAITGLAGHIGHQPDLSRFLLGLGITNNLTADPGANPPMTVLIDGVETVCDTAWLEKDGYYYKHLLLSHTACTPHKEHTVVVPAGTDFNGLPTTEDFTFYVHANNTIDTVPPMLITVNGLGGVVGTQEARYLIALDTDVDFDSVTTNPSPTILVNGEEYAAEIAWLDNGAGVYEWTLIIYRETYPLGVEYTVTVPAGTMIRGHMLTADYTFYIHADGGIDENPPAPVKIAGATIKTETDVSKQGMRYDVIVAPAQVSDAQEIGLLLVPEALLGAAELTVDTAAVLKIATVNGDANWATVLAEGGFQAALTNGTVNGRQNLRIASRAYVVHANGTVEYGDVSVRSITSVSQAIAQTAIDNGATASAEVTALLSQSRLNDAEIATVIEFCRDHIDYL